ncbi:MAG TPA: anti-sigma factor [Solirubrobacteraceae bacterium]|jgi:anti-sigma factor RsiW|nr:anti-sigma factor [Solirubrobacteraceae bacterium]
MTPLDRTPELGGCGADAAAYVLGALKDEEVETFRRHLATCAVCRDEVAALQMVADALPLAVPQLPVPRRLRRRVMSGVRNESKIARAAAARHRSRLTLARRVAAVGGALAVAAAIVGAVVLTSGGSSGARLVQASVAAPAGSAVVRLTGVHAELIVAHMPQPPAGKIYEVWLERDGRSPSPTSALFGVTSTGAGAVDVPGDLHGVSEVLVTPEPLGGSLVPTHAPVIVAHLS